MDFSLPPSLSLALPWEQMDVTRMFGASFIWQKGFVQYDRANDEAAETVGLVQLSIH